MKLFIPGYGNVHTEEWKVDQAVKAYDSRLMFARNEENGDWCIFIKMPRPNDPYPILGFQDRIPDPGEAIVRLKAADTMRHGDRIYNEVVKSQMDYRANLKYNADQAIGDSAERVEHMMRQRGASPIVKVFVGEKGGVASDA